MITHQPCSNCNSSDALTIYHNGEHCFSCGYNKRLNGVSRMTDKPVIEKGLPEDYTTQLDIMPSSVRKQILTELKSLTLQEKYEIGYSEQWKRIIIPSFDRGVFLGWQGRATQFGQNPKYIQASGQKPYIFFAKEGAGRREDFVIIVEDAYSAMIVGEHAPCAALLGSSLDNAGRQLNRLCTEYNRFLIWMDSDVPGQQGARKVIDRLSLVGEILGNIKTKKDPKHLTKAEICHILSTYLTRGQGND